MREVHNRLPRSSVITMSYDVDVRPRWIAVATPVTSPRGRRTVVRGVDVDADGDLLGVGVDRRPDRSERLGQRDGRTAVQQAERLRVALDRHRRHDALGGDLDELDAHLVVQATVALGQERRSAPRRSGRPGTRVHSWLPLWPRSGRFPGAGLSVATARVGGCLDRVRPRASSPPPPPVARRPFAGLPRVLRAAGGELRDGDRTAHQCGLRLHLDARQRPARRGADPRRGRLRQVAADLPPRAVRGVQGQAQQDPRRVPQPAAADPAGARRAADPPPRDGRLRGRRHHRHPRHQRAGRGDGGADPHRRPRLHPARDRAAPPCSTRCAG